MIRKLNQVRLSLGHYFNMTNGSMWVFYTSLLFQKLSGSYWDKPTGVNTYGILSIKLTRLLLIASSIVPNSIFLALLSWIKPNCTYVKI